jgi:hypothetical protein
MEKDVPRSSKVLSDRAYDKMEIEITAFLDENHNLK